MGPASEQRQTSSTALYAHAAQSAWLAHVTAASPSATQVYALPLSESAARHWPAPRSQK